MASTNNADAIYFARLNPQSPLHLPSSGTSRNTPTRESRPSRVSIPSSNHHPPPSRISHRRNTHFPQTSTFRFRLWRRRGEEDVQAFRSRSPSCQASPHYHYSISHSSHRIVQPLDRIRVIPFPWSPVPSFRHCGAATEHGRRGPHGAWEPPRRLRTATTNRRRQRQRGDKSPPLRRRPLCQTTTSFPPMWINVWKS
jgi:hypothetical protein